MMPVARQIIHEVAARHRITPPELITSKCRAHCLVTARIEVAKLLTLRGYSTKQIGAALNCHHSTISFYLARGKKKPAWRKPKLKTVWNLVPYAGKERGT